MESLYDLWSQLPPLALLLLLSPHHAEDTSRVINEEGAPFTGDAMVATMVAAIFIAIAQFAAKSVVAKDIMPLLAATVMLQPRMRPTWLKLSIHAPSTMTKTPTGTQILEPLPT